jgi:GT2 family glycosyltransferase
LSYARNAGIAASTGAIVVATDDDVAAPPDWLETLVARFADPETMVVTGNVLAADLSRASERLFESYGGLGRGLVPRSADRAWFWAFRQSVPTWTLGATANAAFRADVFSHPEIGLFDEALGAGTPAPCSEDTDMFYRVLRAGYRIVYEPQAFVWHHHRATMTALRRQIFGYAKGHAAYQVKTLFTYRDPRALARFFVELPRIYSWRIRDRVFRRAPYTLSLVALEVAGTLAGPLALWRSRRRARRLGRSAPYVPVSERLTPGTAQVGVGLNGWNTNAVHTESQSVQAADAEPMVAGVARADRTSGWRVQPSRSPHS